MRRSLGAGRARAGWREVGWRAKPWALPEVHSGPGGLAPTHPPHGGGGGVGRPTTCIPPPCGGRGGERWGVVQACQQSKPHKKLLNLAAAWVRPFVRAMPAARLPYSGAKRGRLQPSVLPQGSPTYGKPHSQNGNCMHLIVAQGPFFRETQSCGIKKKHYSHSY